MIHTTSDGIKLYYQFVNARSKKSPIVFIHGFVVNHTCFREEINYFKKEGHPILYFDLRGHGKSSKTTNKITYSFERFSKDLEELLKKIHLTKKIILIGHSLGGMIALHFTSTHQSRVQRLVTIDSAEKGPAKHKIVARVQKNKTAQATYMFLAKYYQQTTSKQKENVMKNAIKNTPELFFIKQLFSANPKAMLQIMNTIFQQNIPINIQVPTLIIGSSNDELFSTKQEFALAKKIPQHIIKILPGDHNIIMKSPKRISSEIKQFIHTNTSYFNSK